MHETTAGSVRAMRRYLCCTRCVPLWAVWCTEGPEFLLDGRSASREPQTWSVWGAHAV